MFGIDLSFPQLGHVLHTEDVALDVVLNRPVESIELWREMTLVQAWPNASEVHWREHIEDNAAYTLRFLDGTAHVIYSERTETDTGDTRIALKMKTFRVEEGT